MKNRFCGWCLAAVAALLPVAPAVLAAGGGEQAPPSSELQDDPAKFFVFHREGVDHDTAKAEILYCVEQARDVLSLRDKMPGQGGLFGALLNGRMAEIDRFRMRNAVMRKCLGLFGYDRYAMAAAEWDALVKQGDLVVNDKGEVDPEVIEREAKIASGPRPNTERLPR